MALIFAEDYLKIFSLIWSVAVHGLHWNNVEWSPLTLGNCDFRILCAKFISTSVSLSPIIIASSSNFFSRWGTNNFFHCNIIIIHHRFGSVSIGVAVFITYRMTFLIIIRSYWGRARRRFKPTTVWLSIFILISTAIASSSIILVDLSKENVVVVDSAKQTEISVFLQNSWDGELITKRNLQGSSSPPWIKSTL